MPAATLSAFSPPPPAPLRRAAVAVWVAGGLDLLVFGFCGIFFLFGALLIPDAQLARAPGAEAFNAAQLRAMLWAVVVLVTLFMVAPGVVLLLLGFYVRRGKRWASLTAAIILFSQAALMGLLLMLDLLGALSTGQVLAVVVHLAVLGPLTWLLVWAGLAAVRVWRLGERAFLPPEDSWNSPSAVAPW